MHKINKNLTLIIFFFLLSFFCIPNVYAVDSVDGFDAVSTIIESGSEEANGHTPVTCSDDLSNFEFSRTVIGYGKSTNSPASTSGDATRVCCSQSSVNSNFPGLVELTCSYYNRKQDAPVENDSAIIQNDSSPIKCDDLSNYKFDYSQLITINAHGSLPASTDTTKSCCEQQSNLYGVETWKCSFYSLNTQNNSDKDNNGSGIPIFDDDGTANCDVLIGADGMALIDQVVTWIRIGVPILLILLGSMDLGKVVMIDDKDGMSKAVSAFMKRCIMALAIFFTPMIVKLLLTSAGIITEGAMCLF